MIKNEQTTPTTLAELCDWIDRYSRNIFVRDQDAEGRWCSISLAELSGDKAVHHALRFVKEEVRGLRISMISPEEAGVDTHDKLFDAMHAFVKLTLLFHSSSPWDERKKDEWINLQMIVLKLPSAHRPYRRYAASEATTKVLCDLGRIILG